MNVGVGALSLAVFEVNSCAAPALPSFDAPASVGSGPLPCERLSVALALAAAETACATEAAVAAVTAADIAAADCCAKAAAAAPVAGPLTAAAPGGRSVSEVDKSSVAAESALGALAPCVIAAAMRACAAASVPAAAGALLRVESPGALPEDGAALAAAVVAGFAMASLGFAATVPAVDVSAVASVRKPAGCGRLRPEPAALGPLAEGAVVASAPVAGLGVAVRPGEAAEPGEAAAPGNAVGAGAAAGSGFGKLKMIVAALALAGAVEAAVIAPGTDPCALP